jgi:hypothetical protein
MLVIRVFSVMIYSYLIDIFSSQFLSLFRLQLVLLGEFAFTEVSAWFTNVYKCKRSCKRDRLRAFTPKKRKNAHVCKHWLMSDIFS